MGGAGSRWVLVIGDGMQLLVEFYHSAGGHVCGIFWWFLVLDM
jgi:hypothetical protein